MVPIRLKKSWSDSILDLKGNTMRNGACALLAVALALCMLATPAFAGDCPERVGAWPWPYGQVTAVTTVGDFSYFGIDRVLVVADVTDPAQPVVVGMVELPLPATDIVVSHSHAFVGTDGDGLRIIDVGDPEAPFEVSSYMPPRGRVKGLSVDGRHLWVAVDLDGLRVLDITQPVAPVVVASRDLGEVGAGVDIDVIPPFAYLATGVGILILNTQVPDFPERVGWIKASSHSVAAGDGYVFGLSRFGYLSAIDVSWPASPFQVTQIALEGREGRLTVSDGSLLVACGSDLTVLPADSPEAWWAVSPGVHGTGAGAFDVAITDGLAFLAAGSGGLQTLDVAAPMEPTEIGRVETAGTVLDAVVEGSLTYVVDCPYSGLYDYQPQGPCALRILDLISGAAPTEVGSLSILDVPTEIAVSDGLAFVLSEESLRVIDVMDPVSPVEVSAEFWPWETASDLAVADGYAYVTILSPYPGLRVMDYRTPGRLKSAGWIPGGFTDVAVSGGLVFLSGIGNPMGLWIYDVSDPSSPTEVGFSESPGYAVHIAVSDGYAFLAQGDPEGWPDGRPQMWIYDLSIPDSPVLVGTFEATGAVQEAFMDIEASGGHVYLATVRYESTLKSVLYPRSGLRTVDVRDPTSPLGLNFYETKGDTERVSVSPRGRVLLADGWVGFEVLDVGDCPGFIPPPSSIRRPGGRVTP